MAVEVIQVDQGRVVLSLGKLRLGIQQNEELMRQLGAAQLVSIYRTFDEQGSPAGSWAPLSPNTIRRNPKKYGPGHKLLIDRGRLRNSLTYAVFTGGVKVGTNLVYARVHQLGSADRAGAAIGPQARIAGRAVTRGRSKGRRWQNIPPRPYAVFRPEDPARHAEITNNFVQRRIREAGLEVSS